jgi:predicted Zn-dependent protease
MGMLWVLVAAIVLGAVLPARWAWRRYVGDWFAPPEARNWRDGQANERAKTLFDSDKLLALAAEFPGSPSPLARWTEVAVLERDWPEAVRRAEVFRRHFPGDIFGYLAGARALNETGDYKEAEALLATAAKKFPSHPRPLIDRALVAQYRHDWPEARRRWQHLQRRFPNEERPFAGEGLALMEMGDLAAAETALAAALARFPANRDALLWYADLAHRQGHWAEAAQRWALVRQRCDDRIEGYLRGAEAMRRCDRINEARDILAQGQIIFLHHEGMKKAYEALEHG